MQQRSRAGAETNSDAHRNAINMETNIDLEHERSRLGNHVSSYYTKKAKGFVAEWVEKRLGIEKCPLASL